MATTQTPYIGELTSLVPLSGAELTDSLVTGSKWGTGPAGTAASLTFAFPTSVNAFDTRADVAGNYAENAASGTLFSNYLAGFSAFSAEQQQAARQVLQAWASVAQLSFSEVAADRTDAGVLRFENSQPPGMAATLYGFSTNPIDWAGAGDTWMNAGYLFPEGWAAGTQNFLTLLHEAGHALGLKHPHDKGLGGLLGWIANPVVLPFTGTDTLTHLSTEAMVMAYNDVPGVSLVDGKSLTVDFAPTTPMRYDIAAVQYLYGANMATNAGDTVYTFDAAGRYNQTIWDGGGNDTLVATGTRPVTINLQPGTWSSLGQPLTYSTRNPELSVAAPQPQFTDNRTVFIYDTVTIENATGGDGSDLIGGNAAANRLLGGLGNDSLSGGGGDDTLSGGAGNDSLLGGAGSDTVVFDGDRASYTISFDKDSGAFTVVSAGEGTDRVLGVESFGFRDVTLSASGLSGPLLPSDPLVASQWYLQNTGQRGAPGIDLDLAPIWGRYSGKGVIVAINDEGMDLDHPDLRANYLLDRVYDAVRDTTGQGFANASGEHGTVVGSIVGMVAGDGIGGVGIAYDAKLVPSLTGSGATNARLFLANLASNAGISVNSWGSDPAFAENFGASGTDDDRAWGAALQRAATEGRGGLGMIIEVSGGNERGNRADPGLSNFNGNKYTISVGAVDNLGKVTDYSSAGLALLVTAPGGVASNASTSVDSGYGIASADVSGVAGYNKLEGDAGNYAFQNQGTSYSGPMVAGIAALMLEANPRLGLRDVSSILALTARKNDPGSPSWVQQSGSEWNLDGMHYSRDYGYGLVDGAAAVRLAASWAGGENTVANWSSVSSTSSSSSGKVPDGTGMAFSATATIDSPLVIERLDVDIDLGMLLPSQLSATLTSPSGTRMVLFDRPLTRALDPSTKEPTGPETAWPGHFTMGVVSFLGESAQGTWTLQLIDSVTGEEATFNSLSLRAWGHAAGPQNQYVFTDEFTGTRTLTDPGGIDLVNAAAVSNAVSLSLGAGATSTVGAGSFALAAGTVIENATGGAGDDSLTGNELANVLRGNEGNDTIDGGAGNDVIRGGSGNDRLTGGEGIDVADFRGDQAVAVNLGLGTATQGSDSDTLQGFEVVFGSRGADTLRGIDGEDSKRGETIRGAEGNDTIDGGAGVDAAEWLGPRNDYVITQISATTWTVRDNNLANGDEGTDTITGIERLQFADQVVAFGTRAEDIARVASVLWSPAIFSIAAFSTLFARGFSFYDVGYSFEFMSGVALQFWTADSDVQLAQRLHDNSHMAGSTAQLLAIADAAGGGEAGRAAMVRAAANDPANLAIVDAANVKATGIVADNVVEGFPVLFALVPG